MRRSVRSVLGASILLVSCGVPRFRPQVGQYPDPELIRRAEAIVVGTITSLKVTDEIRLKECLVLVRAGVVVENVLKGHLSNAWVEYYYFGPWCGTTGPVESPQLGSRNVFFLRKEKGYWRPLGDYWKNRIPVRSGRHTDIFFHDKTLPDAIADLLLTPGEFYSDKALAQAVTVDAVGTAIILAGRSRTGTLLRPLVDHPSVRVRVAACIALAEYFEQSGCVEPLLNPFLDRFAKYQLAGITPGFVSDLKRLSRSAGVETQHRAAFLLPVADTLVSSPSPASPAPPQR